MGVLPGGDIFLPSGCEERLGAPVRTTYTLCEDTGGNKTDTLSSQVSVPIATEGSFFSCPV